MLTRLVSVLLAWLQMEPQALGTASWGVQRRHRYNRRHNSQGQTKPTTRCFTCSDAFLRRYYLVTSFSSWVHLFLLWSVMQTHARVCVAGEDGQRGSLADVQWDPHSSAYMLVAFKVSALHVSCMDNNSLAQALGCAGHWTGLRLNYVHVRCAGRARVALGHGGQGAALRIRPGGAHLLILTLSHDPSLEP